MPKSSSLCGCYSQTCAAMTKLWRHVTSNLSPLYLRTRMHNSPSPAPGPPTTPFYPLVGTANPYAQPPPTPVVSAPPISPTSSYSSYPTSPSNSYSSYPVSPSNSWSTASIYSQPQSPYSPTSTSASTYSYSQSQSPPQNTGMPRVVVETHHHSHSHSHRQSQHGGHSAYHPPFLALVSQRS